MNSQKLLSVGIDIGTTTTQLIFSRLTIENQASSFSVPQISITGKEVVFQSAVHFTPLLDSSHIDAAKVRELVRQEYAAAGVAPADVQTGAVIITGETARKDNADVVLSTLSGFAGSFVVATAGPALESILAGKGAGCGELSQTRQQPVLNLDIGGGTTNMALFDNGQVVDTGCLNVGGRLVRYDAEHRVDYISPVIAPFCPLQLGQKVGESDLQPLARQLAQVLEQALGLREPDTLAQFITDKNIALSGAFPLLCFSGGVADTICADLPWDAFGDLGVLLGREIRASRLFDHPVVPARETIRATVIGAGSHSTDLSGSTIFYRQMEFPLKNLPVIALTRQEESLPPAQLSARIGEKAARHPDEQVVLALHGQSCDSFAALQRLGDGIAQGLAQQPAVIVAARADIGKALGQTLAGRLPNKGLVCIDSVPLDEDMYLDIGNPVAGGQALPVVIKTLILS